MSGIRDVWFYANNIISTARQMINDKLKAYNLSSSEGNILLHLFASEDLLKQEDLVAGLEISKAAVSKALNSLEEKGFVRREKDQDDKRVLRIFLTKKAQEMGPAIEKIYNDIFATAAQGVSGMEIEVFISLFKRISDSLSQAKEE